jgi:hypothetical protein
MYYYGPIERQKVIRTAIAAVFNDPELDQRIDKYTVTTEPSDALPTDDFDFVQTNDDTNF